MFNANNVLDLLVEALREGGEVRVREVAKTLVSENYAYVEVADDSINEIVTDILAALNDFDKERALSLITDAPNRLQSNDEEDEGDHEDTTHEARISALETVVRNNGLGYLLPGAGRTHEARISALEGIATSRGLR